MKQYDIIYSYFSETFVAVNFSLLKDGMQAQPLISQQR